MYAYSLDWGQCRVPLQRPPCLRPRPLPQPERLPPRTAEHRGTCVRGCYICTLAAWAVDADPDAGACVAQVLPRLQMNRGYFDFGACAFKPVAILRFLQGLDSRDVSNILT
jgi:hypothetical protein